MSILEKLSVKPFSIIGHRGAAGKAPENTLKGIEEAIDAGVDIVEVDVRSTKDDKLIVLHDKDFKRIAGIEVEAKSVDYDWIAKNVSIEGEKIPTLEDVLELLEERSVGLFIEIKEPETTGKAIELVEKHKCIDRVAIISFHDDALTIARKLSPEIVTGLIYAKPPGRVLDALSLGAKIVLPQYRIATEKSIDFAHKRSLKVVAWTVNEKEEAFRLYKAGIDGIASDVPDEMIDLRRELLSSK